MLLRFLDATDLDHLVGDAGLPLEALVLELGDGRSPGDDSIDSADAGTFDRPKQLLDLEGHLVG